MPDSPKVKNRDSNHSEDDSEVELVEETQKQKNSLSSSWPQAFNFVRFWDPPGHSKIIVCVEENMISCYQIGRRVLEAQNRHK